MKTSKLLGDIALKCIQNKISFKLQYTSHVDIDGLPCSGYFDEKTLCVAVNKKKEMDWLMVLVHEDCHLDQWLEGSEYWVPDKDAISIVEGWIAGKKYTKKRLLQGFNNTIAVELDCEKRSVLKAKKYKLPLNMKQYIQQANSYLFAYAASYHTKKWYKSPYENVKIWSKMPDEFLELPEYLSRFKEFENLFS